ncbi:MAG: helix-turn-helix transcriptional regulator [Microthrixaceae bacterium]
MSLLRQRASEGDLWVEVDGTSMEPTVTAPADALIEPAAKPRWGEVWAFVSATGELTVHRVLHQRPDRRWVLRGDGAQRTDVPVGPESLVGRVVRIRARSALGGGDTGKAGVELARSRSMALRLQGRRVVGKVRHSTKTAIRHNKS